MWLAEGPFFLFLVSTLEGSEGSEKTQSNSRTLSRTVWTLAAWPLRQSCSLDFHCQGAWGSLGNSNKLKLWRAIHRNQSFSAHVYC